MPERQRPERFSVPFMQSVPVELRRPENGADGSLVIALHGMGMSPRSFARDVVPAVPPGSALLLPSGPLPFEVRRPSGIKQGHGWYIYTGDGPEFVESLRRSESWLHYVLDVTLRRGGFDESRVALVGFSQGGYLAGYVALRRPQRFRALVVAGGRIKLEALEEEETAALRDAGAFSVLHVHGAQDEGVAPGPSRESVEALAALGVDARYLEYDCGHAVLRDPDCQSDVRAFLAAASEPSLPQDG